MAPRLELMLWSRLRAVWLDQASVVARPFSRIRTQASHEFHGFLSGIVTVSDTEPLHQPGRGYSSIGIGPCTLRQSL